jgi:chromosome segregation ATPase
VNLLRQEATKVHSKGLAKLADAIATSAGPFDKINQMIQKMIFRLMAEQTDEDAHKNWCDMELGKTEDSKTEKEDKMEILNDKIDSATSKITLLTEDISENMKEVANIDQYIQEETEIREANQKENKAAVKDAKDAQVAIANAMEVLKDFYEKQSAELLQQTAGARRRAPEAVTLPEQPSTWDAGYTG